MRQPLLRVLLTHGARKLTALGNGDYSGLLGYYDHHRVGILAHAYRGAVSGAKAAVYRVIPRCRRQEAPGGVHAVSADYRGTLISIFLVMFVLPQILLLGDVIIEKTSFTLKRRDLIQKRSGYIRVNGRVRGYVSGIVDAQITGIIHGEVSAQLDSDAAEDMKNKVDRQIINHIDADGKHIEDIDGIAPPPAPGGTAEDVDDIMDETEE